MVGFIKQYLLWFKLAAIAAIIVGTFYAGWHIGGKLIQADWDASIIEANKAQTAMLVANAEHVADIIVENNLKNVEVSNEHQIKINELEKAYANARTGARTNGLRFTVNQSSITPITSETTSNSGYDAGATATILLPQSITENLLDLTEQADRTLEVARSCQAWVRVHGFYDGAAKDSKTN